MDYNQLLQDVTTMRKNGAPERVIRAFLRRNGATEETLAKHLAEQETDNPGKEVIQFFTGVVRDLIGGVTAEYGDELEATASAMGGAPRSGLDAVIKMLQRPGGPDPERVQAERNRIDRERQEFTQENPVTSFGSQMAGAIAGGMGASRAMRRLAPNMTRAVDPVKGQPVRNFARRTGEAATIGPPAAALTAGGMYNRDQDPTGAGPGPQMMQAAEDALKFAPAAGVIGPPAEFALKKGAGAIDSIRRMLGGGDRPPPRQPPGPMASDYDANSKGLELVARNLEADGMKIQAARDEVNRQARIAGPDDVMLPDVAGENTTTLGRAFADKVGTSGASIGPRVVSDRQALQGARMQQALRDPNTQGLPPQLFQRRMQEQRQGELSDQYEELMPLEVEGVQLRQIVDRDPSGKLLQSYEDARSQRIGAEDPTRPDPGPFEAPYTLRKVQMMKGVMDEEINKTTNVVSPSFSGRERGSAVGSLQSQMLDQVDRAAPAFAKVRDLYSRTFRLGERVEEGAVAFKQGTPQLMREDMQKMSPAEQEAYRAGFIGQFDAMVERLTNDAVGDSGARAADVARRLRNDNIKRIAAIFGSAEQFEMFRQKLAIEVSRSRTTRGIVGNSTTNRQGLASDMLAEPNEFEQLSTLIDRANPNELLRQAGIRERARNMRQLGDQFAPRFFARGQDNVLGLLDDVEAYQRNLPLYNQNRGVRGFGVSYGLGRGFLEDE